MKGRLMEMAMVLRKLMTVIIHIPGRYRLKTAFRIFNPAVTIRLILSSSFLIGFDFLLLTFELL